MNEFSYSIDIKRFQNLLATSIDETERKTLRRLLTEEQAKATPPAAEPKQE